MPNQTYVEKDFSPEVMAELKKREREVVEDGRWGDGECIAIDLKTGDRLSASDIRNNGKAVGH